MTKRGVKQFENLYIILNDLTKSWVGWSTTYLTGSSEASKQAIKVSGAPKEHPSYPLFHFQITGQVMTPGNRIKEQQPISIISFAEEL